jgi:hypothetical protein
MALNNRTYNFSDFVGKKIFANTNCFVYKKSTDKNAFKIIKKGQLIGICQGYIYNKAQKAWWLFFKDDKGIPFGIPQDVKTNSFPQIDMAKLTDQLVNAGVKSREEQKADTTAAYNKSPFDALQNQASTIFKKYGIYIAGAFALLLFARKK